MKPKFADYSFEIKPLTAAEGGGFLITFPDLPGCMSDGETPEEAIKNGKDAFDCWMGAQVEWGRPIPAPFSTGMPGKFVQRVPKSLHAKLSALAKQEGVSINTLVLSFIAEGVGMEEAHAGKAGDEVILIKISVFPVLLGERWKTNLFRHTCESRGPECNEKTGFRLSPV